MCKQDRSIVVLDYRANDVEDGVQDLHREAHATKAHPPMLVITRAFLHESCDG